MGSRISRREIFCAARLHSVAQRCSTPRRSHCKVNAKSPRGAQIAKTMESGELVPQAIVLALLKEAMLKAIEKDTKGFLIDGYPREVSQGVRFENEISKATLVVYFYACEETLTKRLMKRAQTSDRKDDNLTTIKQRLKTFETATKPVVDHYSKEGKLVKVNAEGGVEEIFAAVCSKIDTITVRK